jgi:hypothetical protein
MADKYRSFIRQPAGRKPLRAHRRKREECIKIDVKEIGPSDVN